jgi:hypothetical protein
MKAIACPASEIQSGDWLDDFLDEGPVLVEDSAHAEQRGMRLGVPTIVVTVWVTVTERSDTMVTLLLNPDHPVTVLRDLTERPKR